MLVVFRRASDSILSKLFPKTFEFSIVLFDIVGMIYDENIFLIALSSLDGPVERPSNQVRIVNHNEFVVHVELRSIICSHCDALV
jgi:hypothetical protein